LNGKNIVMGIARDVTDRKRLEFRLGQAQKMESIGTLAGGIAHDFNNILSSVIGYTELALEEIDRSSAVAEYLIEVCNAGNRARDLVKQILAFARQSDDVLKPVQVSAIAKEVLKLIRASIPATIDIQPNIHSDSLVMANPSQIHQIFMNICTNAAHAMEEQGGTLTVCLQDVAIQEEPKPLESGPAPGDYLKITFADTGKGIAPEIIDAVFEPYFTTKAPGEGTGMGLAMVHGIVGSYGGHIDVESTVGQGTVFSIHLPITKKRGARLTLETEPISTGNERILFVDDEAPIADMSGRLLEQLGYRVTTRTSSTEALALFNQRPLDFDLVISDMTMPNMTGDRLALELLQIRPDLPVILCTGYSKRISEDTAVKIGVKAFIYKPIVKKDLAAAVRRVLDA